MKKFIGYYIIGAASKEEATNERGLILWSQRKPGWFTRLMNRWLLQIYWIDRLREGRDLGKTQMSNNANTELPKYDTRASKQPNADPNVQSTLSQPRKRR